MKRDEKLYNVLFPLWFLLLVPISWLIVIPANFVIDLLALLLAMKLLRMPDIGKNLKSAVLKSWLAGFAADLVGGGAMFLSVLAGEFLPDPVRSWVYHNITEAVMVNPFSSVGGFLWTAVCVALAGGIIYTVGGVIYALKLPIFNARHKNFGSHEIFHLFVMGGSICHFIVMYVFVAPMPL